MKLRACFVVVCFLSTICATFAQSTPAAATVEVPRLIKFSGVAKDESGKPIAGTVGVTFLLYQSQQDGAPLWMETQNVLADSSGHYTAMLGATSANGLPLALFSSAEVHWISTQIAGKPEQPRTALLSVPYALKAADAETLGGLPASAFMPARSGAVAKSVSGTAPSSSNAPPPAGVTGKGTKNFVPLWTGATTQGNSAIFQTGGNVGVGTKTPGATVDSVGAGISVRGTSSGKTGIGVFGNASSSTGANFGVFGQSASTSNGATGVFGNSTGTTGITFGVAGVVASASGVGVQGSNNSNSGGSGVVGFANAATGAGSGVFGQSASPSGYGVLGVNNAKSSGVGVAGNANSSTGTGVFGNAVATSGLNFGVQGISASSGGIGIQAQNTATSGFVALATGGQLINAFVGSKGMFSVDNSGNGFFAGNLNVTGKLTKGSGSFKIDHPLDPANKYLSHSFVESPDMMNVYNGVVELDTHGSAWVTLPEYFEALNRDFRYQLTAVGKPGPNLYIAQEISGNRFKISGGRARAKVSWQVTGIRQDAYAKANRIPVEEDKSARERGFYLHPEAFGQPESKSIAAAQQAEAGTRDVLADASSK